MTNTDKKTMVNSQIRIIKELINKKASNEEKAKRFIQILPVFTELFSVTSGSLWALYLVLNRSSGWLFHHIDIYILRYEFDLSS
jgi:hypothetical protein